MIVKNALAADVITIMISHHNHDTAGMMNGLKSQNVCMCAHPPQIAPDSRLQNVLRKRQILRRIMSQTGAGSEFAAMVNLSLGRVQHHPACSSEARKGSQASLPCKDPKPGPQEDGSPQALGGMALAPFRPGPRLKT